MKEPPEVRLFCFTTTVINYYAGVNATSKVLRTPVCISTLFITCVEAGCGDCYCVSACCHFDKCLMYIKLFRD